MLFNKKGITVVELIVTIALISLLLLFLFKILTTLNGEDKLNNTDIEILALNSSVTKNLENIFIESDIKSKNDALNYFEIKDNKITIKYSSSNKEDYTLPNGYNFEFVNNSEYVKSSNNILQIIIKIYHGSGEKKEYLDDRYTIKLYYYDKNYS